jgi:hypothetical protein
VVAAWTMAEMSGLTAVLLVPALVLFAVFSTASWVYADAKAQRERGTPAVLSVGAFELSTPKGWFLGCLFVGRVLPVVPDRPAALIESRVVRVAFSALPNLYVGSTSPRPQLHRGALNPTVYPARTARKR